MSYGNKFRYEMIVLLCNGESVQKVHKEYGVAATTIIKWLRRFISGELFDESEVSSEKKEELKILREEATRIELQIRAMGQSKDITLQWILQYDPELEEWRALAEEWLKTQVRAKGIALSALSRFIKDYVIQQEILKSPVELLNVKFDAPDFYAISFIHFSNQQGAVNMAKKVVAFIEWMLEEKFSIEDDFGYMQIPLELHNPLEKFLPVDPKNSHLSQSDKNVLPYRYIRDSRNILCPSDAVNFEDWKFAQKATGLQGGGCNWFEVDKSFIDENDPDCVFRKRETSKYERKIKGLSDEVYELWSPVTSVALLIKLFLPLRTYQVRMLDSGEQDTFKYIQSLKSEQGEWIENDSIISKGTKDKVFRKGVLRRFNDPVAKMEMTGFFINTNKTADIEKEEDQKGYEIPWQYEEVLYWLAKLRNWQQRYNPVKGPTPWLELEYKHLSDLKDEKILRQMGSTTFLFRTPSVQGEEHLPLRRKGLNSLWHKVLRELENVLPKSLVSEEEKAVKFVKNARITFYPLHSLRVSLITAYALEGGVPMPILSKAIAGHASLVMTLYYTKAGISYVTDQMEKAEQNILENDKKSFVRFIRDAKYDKLELGVATNDPIAFQAVIDAQESGASIIKGDKGICLKGNFGCDSGGVFVNDDSGKITYGPVPGFPEQNCVRCRWFVTGPAFLPSLVHHFNTIGYNMSETGKRIKRFQSDIEGLENKKYECEIDGQLVTGHNKLMKFEKLQIQEIQKNDKLANDYNATLRLIDKCIAILRNQDEKEGIQLVPVGSISDIRLIIDSADDELEQIQILCNGAEIYPETDASKAILQRSQIIDLTLVVNGQRPVMFTLTEEQQLMAGNQFMRLMIAREGSLKGAVPYATGRKKLEEMGLINKFIKGIEAIKLTRSRPSPKNTLQIAGSCNLKQKK